MRQVEISRTIVFDAPRHARGRFEALVADNPGHRPPAQCGDHLRPQDPPRHPGNLRTAIDRRDNGGVLVTLS
jgi:hypothetical protein